MHSTIKSTIQKSHFIFYVKDQFESSRFYENILGTSPILEVPGMTEFQLTDSSILGLMPELNIKELLKESNIDPALARNTPRSEIYIYVDNPEEYSKRLETLNAKILSPLSLRNWGDSAIYASDPDGHIIAFAKKV